MAFPSGLGGSGYMLNDAFIAEKSESIYVNAIGLKEINPAN
jgi:hypothetical protein